MCKVTAHVSRAVQAKVQAERRGGRWGAYAASVFAYALGYRCIALLTTLFEDLPLTLGVGVLCAPKMSGSSHFLAAAVRSWITVEDALAAEPEKLQSPHCAADISKVRGRRALLTPAAVGKQFRC